MKKIILLLVFLLTYVNIFAQNFYNFTKSSENYVDLTNATSLNNGQSWLYDLYGPIPNAFPIQIFGNQLSEIYFEDNNFTLTNSDASNYTVLIPFPALISDRNLTGTGTSLSPISYKVDGIVGDRILKLEVKNAGLESDFDLSSPETSTSTHFVNYQIWFYEVDNSFEYRFGANNITNLSTLNPDSRLYSAFFSFIENGELFEFKSGVADTSVTSPIYSESYTEDDIPVSFTSMIPANTVYRFEVITLSNQDNEKVNFVMYPNPTSDVLNLSFSENLDKNYSVYDLLGREVLKGKFENTSESQIAVEKLQIGTYILRIGGTTKKFIKK